MRFGSLFAGIGGFDLGLERAGMECRWQVEIDDFCNRVLEKHWPHVKRYRDVREVGAHNLEPVDVICGGFPCQDISEAGKRAGIDGERSGLWTEYARIVGELGPKYVVVENVAALLNRGMGKVLGDLAALGYDAEWDIFSACEIQAPHTRERVFIVAYPESQRRDEIPILSKGNVECQRVSCEAWRNFRVLPANGNSNKAFCFPDTGTFRIPDGFPDWVDRIGALGNAVVPQIAEIIGRAIMEPR